MRTASAVTHTLTQQPNQRASQQGNTRPQVLRFYVYNSALRTEAHQPSPSRHLYLAMRFSKLKVPAKCRQPVNTAAEYSNPPALPQPKQHRNRLNSVDPFFHGETAREIKVFQMGKIGSAIVIPLNQTPISFSHNLSNMVVAVPCTPHLRHAPHTLYDTTCPSRLSVWVGGNTTTAITDMQAAPVYGGRSVCLSKRQGSVQVGGGCHPYTEISLIQR